MIDECNLNKIKLHGHPFTWEIGRGTDNWVQERHDRVFVSATRPSLFPSCKLVNLVAGVPNHSPIILHIVVVDRVRRQSKFRV